MLSHYAKLLSLIPEVRILSIQLEGHEIRKRRKNQFKRRQNWKEKVTGTGSGAFKTVPDILSLCYKRIYNIRMYYYNCRFSFEISL